MTSLGLAEIRLDSGDLEGAVAKLDPEFRDIYRLHALEGRSYAEIAAQLDLPQNTVGTRLLRARKKLRELARTDEALGAAAQEALDRIEAPKE